MYEIPTTTGEEIYQNILESEINPMDILKAKRVLECAISDGVLSNIEIEALNYVFEYLTALSRERLPNKACLCSDCIYAERHLEITSDYELDYYSCKLLGGDRVPYNDGFCSFRVDHDTFCSRE